MTTEKPPRAAIAPTIVRRVIVLAITGIGLYLVWPSMLVAYSAWPDLLALEPAWLLAIGLLQAMSFFSTWVLLEVSMKTHERFVVATSQLAGNAASKIVPGGAAAGGALQFQMLREGGLETSRIATGLGVATTASTAMLAALPLLALPPILAGAPVDSRLVNAVWMGAALFLILMAAGAVLLFTDRPVILAGRLVRAVLRALHRSPPDELPELLLARRNEIRAFLGQRWRMALGATAGKIGFDYLALVAAVAAVGAEARPSLILLAFVASQILAMIPITPGGLGFVELGLTTALGLAGVPATEAVVASLAYRLFSYWLPLPIGAAAFALFRRRLSRRRALG